MSSSVTLYDDAGNPVVVSGEALKRGLATAWVNFDDTGTLVVNNTFNIASVELISVGLVKITFARPMDNLFYTLSHSAGDEGVSAKITFESSPSLNRTVNSCMVQCSNELGDVNNWDIYSSITVFGGKS